METKTTLSEAPFLNWESRGIPAERLDITTHSWTIAFPSVGSELALNGKTVKINCSGKVEQWLNNKQIKRVRLFSKHPAMDQYQCSIVQIFVSSAAAHPDALAQHCTNYVQTATGHLRRPNQYVNECGPEILRSGHGSFYHGPVTLSEHVEAALTASGVDFTKFEYPKPHHQGLMLLELGKGFVIAKSFTVEALK